MSCIPQIRDPDPPGTDALENAYDAPSGRLTGDRIRSIADSFAERLRELESIGDLSQLQALIDTIRDEENGVVPDGTLAEDEGGGQRVLIVAQVERKCRIYGSDTSTPDAVDAGVIELTVKAGERGIYPIVWGRFVQCHSPVGRLDTILDGEVFARLRESDRGPVILYSFKGTVQVGDVVSPLSLSFRRYQDGIREVLFPGTGGDVVFEVRPETTRIARDSVGLWTCDLAQASCISMETGETISAADEVPK